jgi:RNA recognition motif-containing protein
VLAIPGVEIFLGATLFNDLESMASLPPTRVLYVRNIPDSVTDTDLIQYCSPFGQVIGTLILKEKGHGFIEFDTLEASSAACSYFQGNPLVLHGFHVEFTFSQRQEITPRKDPDANPPNRIILLTVTNIMYPVTVDVLSQIFAKYGGMEKVIIFNRGNAIQALVQLRDIPTASTCRSQLDGQNIYAGCNSLKVQYSSLNELEVKQNNDRMFDFTAPVIPKTNFSSFGRSSFMGSLSPMASAYQFLGSYSGAPSPKAFGEDYMSLSGGAPVIVVEGIDDSRTHAEHLAALFALYGNVVRVKLLKNRETALVQMEDLDQCGIAMEFLNGLPVHGRPIALSLSKGGAIPPPDRVLEEGDSEQSVKEFTPYPLLYARHRPEKPQRLYYASNTLHISNMPDGTLEEDLIAVLVSQGGAQVEMVRFLDDQHHLALVVCSSPENALDTLVSCHGQLVSSGDAIPRPMRVGFSQGSDLGAHAAVEDYLGTVEYGLPDAGEAL